METDETSIVVLVKGASSSRVAPLVSMADLSLFQSTTTTGEE